jgi:uncharacterized protein YqjF (DUF2071 family)
MIDRWDNLTFLHWSFPRAEVQRLIPPPLEVETFDGWAWVGLVPFVMQVRPPPAMHLPARIGFPETNVRTYVRAPDGSTGVWFLSLDAADLSAVVTARTTYRLPYFWSSMSVQSSGSSVSYRSRRRWPGPAGASTDVAVEVGPQLETSALGDFDHWLTARYRLFSVRGARRQRYALADHAPWVLHEAHVRRLDETLLEAAGLRRPDAAPVVHWSPGVEVRIGLPRRIVARQ